MIGLMYDRVLRGEHIDLVIINLRTFNFSGFRHSDGNSAESR